MSGNGYLHTGTSDNSNYAFSVPEPGKCALTDGYPASYFDMNNEGQKGYFTVTIDWDKRIQESNENNNIRAGLLTVSNDNKPDLIIKNFNRIDFSEFDQNWGAKVEFEFDMTNIGTGKPTDNFKLRVKNLTNNKILKDQLYGYIYFEPNYTSHVYVVGKVGDGFVAGDNKIEIFVDSYNNVDESNENNNKLTKTITIEDEGYPEIYNINVENVTQNSAKITWHTNGDYNCSVPYSKNLDLNNGTTVFGAQSQQQGSILSWSYYANLDGLDADTVYYYKIICSKDQNHSSESNVKSFSTLDEDDGGSILVPLVETQENDDHDIDDQDPVAELSTLAQRVNRQFLLAVESNGRIYYPVDGVKYEVTFGNVLSLFQHLALGVSNENIYKIPINPNSVSDDKDSDGDGFSDYNEVIHGYNPDVPSDPNNRGNDKMHFDYDLANRLIGYIVIRPEDRGRIDYIDQSGKRWEITFANVMNVFTSLSLGISDNDLAQLSNAN